MTDVDELVLNTFGFRDGEGWKNDPRLGGLDTQEIMQKLGCRSLDQWEDEVMPLHQEIQSQIADQLLKLWFAIGKSPDPDQFKVYFMEFRDYPPEVLEQGITSVLRVHQYNNIPMIATILKEIKDRQPS